MSGQEFCDDKTLIVTYLYGECDEAGRRAVDAHLATCPACAAELEQLRSVRTTLAGWPASGRQPAGRIVGPISEALVGHESASQRRAPVVPRWLQAAAAVLVLGAAAGVAQLDVRVDDGGVVVRTGWIRSASADLVPVAAAAAPPAVAPAEDWRPELAALEADMRRELAALEDRAARAARAGAPGPVTAAARAGDTVLLGQVQRLIAVSEQRLEREMAEQLAAVIGEVEVQRRADLRGIQQTFGQLEGQADIAVRQNQELYNYLVRASQQR